MMNQLAPCYCPYQQRIASERFVLRRERRHQRLTLLTALLEGKAIDSGAIEPAARLNVRSTLLDPSQDRLTGRKLFEAIIGANDALPRGFLLQGNQVANAVCQVLTHQSTGILNRRPTYGTAIAIAPGLILTNHHVLPTIAVASTAVIKFGHWADQNRQRSVPITVSLAPQQIFYTDRALDFTLVSFDSGYAQTVAQQFGTIPLLAESGKALLGEPVNIIHHGGGGEQQVSLRNNRVVDTFDQWMHYTTDTEPGASGAPVFNDQWQLAALHHAAIQRRTHNGKQVTVNEGIRISAITQHLQQRLGGH